MNGEATLSSCDGYTIFRYGDYIIRFVAPYSLEKYISVKEWDVLVLRLTHQGAGTKISLPEINQRISELLKQSIKSDGVINLFSDVGQEFSLFDPKFFEQFQLLVKEGDF